MGKSVSEIRKMVDAGSSGRHDGNDSNQEKGVVVAYCRIFGAGEVKVKDKDDGQVADNTQVLKYTSYT